MTFNGSWGYMPSAVDWHSPRAVVLMLRTAAAGQGNLLLNIGPKPDGSPPEEAVERLAVVGQWLRRNGEAVYGEVERAKGRMETMPTGYWTLRGNTAYFWADKWPGNELVIGGLKARVLKASFVATGEAIPFEQTERQFWLRQLPADHPDQAAGVTVIKLECASPPHHRIGHGYVEVENAWPVSW
jgi:alpha-L-fucosidase